MIDKILYHKIGNFVIRLLSTIFIFSYTEQKRLSLLFRAKSSYSEIICRLSVSSEIARIFFSGNFKIPVSVSLHFKRCFRPYPAGRMYRPRDSSICCFFDFLHVIFSIPIGTAVIICIFNFAYQSTESFGSSGGTRLTPPFILKCGIFNFGKDHSKLKKAFINGSNMCFFTQSTIF